MKKVSLMAEERQTAKPFNITTPPKVRINGKLWFAIEVFVGGARREPRRSVHVTITRATMAARSRRALYCAVSPQNPYICVFWCAVLDPVRWDFFMKADSREATCCQTKPRLNCQILEQNPAEKWKEGHRTQVVFLTNQQEKISKTFL